jgi:hypothetical protein
MNNYDNEYPTHGRFVNFDSIFREQISILACFFKPKHSNIVCYLDS